MTDGIIQKVREKHRGLDEDGLLNYDAMWQELIEEIRKLEPYITTKGSGMSSEIAVARLLEDLIGDNG